MRRTVLNKNGDWFTCGQAYEPVGAAVGPMGIDCPGNIWVAQQVVVEVLAVAAEQARELVDLALRCIQLVRSYSDRRRTRCRTALIESTRVFFCPAAHASQRSRPSTRGPDCRLTSVSYMAPLPVGLAMRPPRSTLWWSEYPVGADICVSGAAMGRTFLGGSNARCHHKMATPMPPAIRWIIAVEIPACQTSLSSSYKASLEKTSLADIRNLDPVVLVEPVPCRADPQREGAAGSMTPT
jgi:hypothetical protein